MRKFTESIASDNIFTNEDLLKDILIDYGDIGLKYTINYGLQALRGENLVPIKLNSRNRNDCWDPKTGKIFMNTGDNTEYVKFYVIGFYDQIITGDEKNQILTKDAQRTGKEYGIPNDVLYQFFEISKGIQKRIESMGNTFAMSIDSYYDLNIMIVEGHHI